MRFEYPAGHESRQAAAVFALILLYATEIPIASLAARVFANFFMLGWLARKSLGLRESKNAIFEAIAVSFGLTSSVLLITGNFVEISSILNKGIFAAMIAALYLRNGIPKFELPKKEIKHVALLFLFPLATIGGMLLLNPQVGLISDGWWHCSILNTIGAQKLPPSNPWMADTSLAYPYAFHTYLSYVVGGSLFCLNAFGLFSILTTFAFLLGIYGIVRDRFGNAGGTSTALTYFFLSTIGGIVFLFDAATKIASTGIGKFLAFLKDVHGPHQWYAAMKFLGLGGAVIAIFNHSAMVGTPQLFLMVASLYFALKGNGWGLLLSFAPLPATSPIVAIITGIGIALYLLWKNVRKGLAMLVLLGAFTAAVSSSYILTVLSKLGTTYSAPLFGTSMTALGSLLIFVVGYLPLIGIALYRIRKGKTYGKTADMLFLFFTIANFIVFFLFSLGPLYFSLTLFLPIALYAGPWFADCLRKRAKLVVALLLSISSLLVLASYAYYKIPVDANELAASAWLRENTPADAVILSYINTGAERQTFMYSSTFGGRRNYIGDLTTLDVYGENYSENLKLFNSVFLERNGGVICSLKAKGIDYLYVDNPAISASLEVHSCIQKVYGNAGVSIFKAL